MAKQWFVRPYGVTQNDQFVVSFDEKPLLDLSHKTTASVRIEKVLNRELPDGKVRNRKRSKVVI